MKITPLINMRILGLAACAGLAIASSARGQVIDWANAGGGGWNTALNWSPANVPNVSSESARIALGGPYIVSVGGSFSIGDLEVTGAGVQLGIENGSSLSSTSLLNNELVLVNSAAGTAQSVFGVAGGAAYNATGLGTLRLNANAANLETAVVIWTSNSTTEVLHNAPSHTIAGTGSVYARFVNNGLVSADVAGRTLRLNSQAKTNNARMEAINGGTLQVQSIAITQGPFGLIDVIDGFMTTSSISVIGGEIRTDSDPVSFAGTTNLSDVKLTGAFEVPNGSTLYYTGATLDLTGTLAINPTAGTGSTGLFATGTVVLPATAQTILNANAANVDTALLMWRSNSITDNYIIASGHAVRGTGSIYARFINDGLISADVNGRSLRLNSQPKTNNARIEAINGGNIWIPSIAITQGVNGIIDVTDGSLTATSITVNGGEIRTDSDPVSFAGTTTLNVVKLTGAFDVPNGSSLNYTGATLDLSGTLTINPTAGTGSTGLFANGTVLLPATAQTILNANVANVDTALLFWSSNATTDNYTIAPGHVARGTGSIYARFINEGLISADVNGRSLRLNSQPKTNNARIEAINGGDIWIPSIAITQGVNGIIDVTDGSLTATSITVNGGEVRTDSDPVSFAGSTNLNTVKLTGAFEVPNGSSLNYTGSTLDLSGTLTINPTAGSSSTTLVANGSVSLPGTSQTILNANGSNLDTAYLIWSSNATTDRFDLAPGHTLRGTGSFYARFTNDGLISADVNGRSLRLNSQPKTNNARIEAINGGTIRIESISITQGASGEIDAIDGILSTSGTTIAGGTVRLGGANPWAPTGTTTLSAITKFGPLHLPNGSTISLAGGSLVNNGELMVSNGVGASGTNLVINGTTVVSGLGSVVLNASSNFGTAYIVWNSNPTTDTLTLGTQQAFRGNGDIYARTFIDGTLSPGVTTGAVGRFGLVSQRLTLNPTATYIADIDGVAAGQFDTISGSASITIDGTLQVRFGGGFSPLPGQTFAIINGPVVTGRFDRLDMPKGWWIEYNPNSVIVSFSGCYADWDQDGDVDSDDIVLFFGDFENGEGDVDGDDDTDSDDIIEFFTRFENGC